MREMTTAEFAKANLQELKEPVQLRRYTKVIGTYYPQSVEPPQGFLDLGPDATPDQVEAIRTDLGGPAKRAEIEARRMSQSIEDEVAPIRANKVIADLTAEVAMLKKELAARAPLPESWQPQAAAVGKLTSKDVFADLPKQDREFFERKLGTKKK